MARYTLHPCAREDIVEIVDHYRYNSSVSIVQSLIDEVDSAFDRIAEQPKSFPTFKADIRRANLKRFPYNILFRVTNDAVSILAVRHHRRHPGFGTRRR